VTDRQFGFGFGHRLIAVVNTFWVEQQQRAALVRLSGIRRKCTRNQFDAAIQIRRKTVHGTNERVLAAPDHSHFQFA